MMSNNGKETTKRAPRLPPGILRKQLGYKREFPEPNIVRVTIPTLPYEGLDCSGKKMLPWSIMKLFESTGLGDFWSLRKDPDDDIIIYLMNYELKVDHTFYQLETPKFPLVVEQSTKYVNRSSWCIQSTLLHPSRIKPYAVGTVVNINMDPVLRVPKPLPQWWKDRYKFPTQGERREFKLPPKPSVGVFSSKHRVEFSDTDVNMHTNYTVYVRMSFNSMCEHILAGNYGTGLGVYEIGLKTLQITFLKECGLGDVLTVSSWASKETKDTFYFELCKGDVLCTTLLMSFYNLFKGQPFSTL